MHYQQGSSENSNETTKLVPPLECGIGDDEWMGCSVVGSEIGDV